MAVYVLDTSAIVAYLYDEEGADSVEALVSAASHDQRVLIPFAALMEVEYKLLRAAPEKLDATMATLSTWPCLVRDSEPGWRRLAAQIRAASRVSFADAWIASLALMNDAELVHKDPEFDTVVALKALRLPYDRDAGSRRR